MPWLHPHPMPCSFRFMGGCAGTGIPAEEGQGQSRRPPTPNPRTGKAQVSLPGGRGSYGRQLCSGAGDLVLAASSLARWSWVCKPNS